MKFIRQFCIIIVISLLGEILKRLIPLPIPASIYGLVLLLAALQTGFIPLEAVRETSLFLVEIMPLMFIPAAVGLLESWGGTEACFASGGGYYGSHHHYCYGDYRQGHTACNPAG